MDVLKTSMSFCKILLIEDSQADSVLFQEYVREAISNSVEIDLAVTLDEGIQQINLHDYDIIILDLSLPDASGLQTVISVYDAAPHIPIVVLTGLDDYSIAVKAIREGVQDYLVKNLLNPNTLKHSIQYAIERKRTEDALRKSLEEKEILLKEVHHRVKNNLQLVSSMLSLQARTISDPVTVDMFRECEHRVHAMALLHELLYDNENLEAIDFKRYVRSLVSFTFQSFSTPFSAIELVFKLDNVIVTADVALKCGLILSELVANALQHAFAGQEKGEITIELVNEQEGGFTVSVCDNGSGSPGLGEQDKLGGIGLMLVEQLVSELAATMKTTSLDGTMCRISVLNTGE